MLNTKSFLAVDFGAGSLKLAEFEVNEAGGLRLKQYGLKSLGAEGAQDSAREAVVQSALQGMLAEKGIKARNVNVCAPGFHVFSKFVKLPPVDANKVTQMIQYEAQQNVPFPLEEVVWDYQILGSTPGGELEVLLVAIKADIVEGLFRVTVDQRQPPGTHAFIAGDGSVEGRDGGSVGFERVAEREPVRGEGFQLVGVQAHHVEGGAPHDTARVDKERSAGVDQGGDVGHLDGCGVAQAGVEETS